jgi:hypothetical protein
MYQLHQWITKTRSSTYATSHGRRLRICSRSQLSPCTCTHHLHRKNPTGEELGEAEVDLTCSLAAARNSPKYTAVECTPTPSPVFENVLK